MKSFFEQFLNGYESKGSLAQFSNKISAYQYDKPFTVISNFFDSERNFLDWGSGNGHLSAFLLHNNQKTTAYGFGETSAPSAIAGNDLLKFIAADTNEPVKLPFADGSFDLVVSMGVLEHVHEFGGTQHASLEEIYRILKPGGSFLCFHFPYSGSWVETFHKAIMPFKKRKTYVHTKRFSKNNVMQLCRDAKFELNEWGRYNFLPRNFSQKLSCEVANNTIFLTSFNTIDALLSRVSLYFAIKVIL